MAQRDQSTAAYSGSAGASCPVCAVIHACAACVQANEVAAERAKGELGEKLAHENGKESTHKKVRGPAVRACVMQQLGPLVGYPLCLPVRTCMFGNCFRMYA